MENRRLTGAVTGYSTIQDGDDDHDEAGQRNSSFSYTTLYWGQNQPHTGIAQHNRNIRCYQDEVVQELTSRHQHQHSSLSSTFFLVISCYVMTSIRPLIALQVLITAMSPGLRL